MRGLIEEARLATIVTCIYRDGSVRLWPLKRPKTGEKDNEAWISARAAAREAMTEWVRLVWVRRAYEIRKAQPGFASEPDWAKLPEFDQLMKLAVGPNGIMRDTNHPIYRELIGAGPSRHSRWLARITTMVTIYATGGNYRSGKSGSSIPSSPGSWSSQWRR